MLDSSSSERQRLIGAIAESYSHLSTPEILRELRERDRWLSLPPHLRATLYKAIAPEESDTSIADLVGVHRSTLNRSALYQRLKTLLAAAADPMRGKVDLNGNIEAWE